MEVKVGQVVQNGLKQNQIMEWNWNIMLTAQFPSCCLADHLQKFDIAYMLLILTIMTHNRPIIHT